MNKRRIKLPIARTGYQVRGSLANDVPAFGGADYNAYIGKPSPRVRKTMGAVPREEANLEAEGGETLVGDLDGSTFPSFFSIKGPRHSAGGVPMNLPDDTFIFSDTASMKISDPKILKMFNKSPKKGGYTPAELSKSYDINKYRKTLQDPESNKMEKKTAEMMIKNYVMKLGALAIAQESKKGFPQGIPVIAEPYMEANKITEADLIPEVAKQQQEQQQMMAQQQMAQDRMMPQEGAPEQMPSGEPIAQPSMEEQMQGAQEMSPEQMQEAPMAMYGIEMGGYGVPFAAYGMALGVNSNNYMGRTKHNLGSGPFLNRQMAEEGIIIGGTNQPLIMANGGFIDIYQGGGNTRQMTDEELEARRQKQKDIEKVKKCPEGYKLVNGFCQKGSITTKEEAAQWHKRTSKYDPSKNEAFKKSMCQALSSGEYKGKTAQWLANSNIIAQAAVADLSKCENKDEIAKKQNVEEYDVKQLEETPETPGCQCEDPNAPGYQPKDENGKCPCEVEKCYCIDPATGQEVETPLTNGKCMCEEEEVGGGYGATYEMPMQWTPQDERNLGTAMRTRTGIEYPTAMTYQYPEVELAKEEWLSKVQGLQGQAAKNLDVLAGTAGSAASKQATAASLQGDVAEGIVNAIASTQARNVGTENQERLTNYQGDIAEGLNRQNILNQYIDKVGSAENNYRGELNAKDALTTQMINQGDTNAANIYNLQTDQYAIDPRTGKRVFKGGKPLDPEKPDQDVIAYAQELEASGIPEDMQELILKQRLSRYGGPVLQMGGMVYGDMVYPFYYYE
jgi:hypothetical protein